MTPTLIRNSTGFQLFARTSFWNAKLPALQRVDPLNTTVVNEIVAQTTMKDASGNPYYPNINTTSYSSKIIVVDKTTPRVKVRLTPSPPQPWAKAFADLCMMGVPIPAGVTLPLASDTDAEMIFYDPANDQLWEFWRFRVNSDMVSLDAGVPYECAWGGRMSHVSTSPGYWVDRWSTWQFRAYPDLPKDPAKVADFEQKSFGATATSLPLTGGILTEEDVITDRVNHAIGLSLMKLRAKTWRWPAQRNDGNDPTVQVCEGMRLRFPGGMATPPNLHPIARLYFQAIRDYGCVIWDKAGAVGFRAEPSIQGYLGITPKYKVLNGFPWNKLQLMVEGNPTAPNL